ncbi:hypothetical protein IKG45_02525 [Candidatus Saccharibacteria bacterium]|nr:hypothetical protein [Candidatus Saccharibacteria bacterium]
MQNEESLPANSSKDAITAKNPWQEMADEVLASNSNQQSGEQDDNSESIKKKAELVASEDEKNVYHVEGVLTAENIAEINSFKNKTTLILENTRGLTSDVLSQIDSDRVFFSVKGGLDYESIDKYNTDNYKERTMMSPKGLERAIRYFERVESKIDPNWTETQKCMYAYNCLAVDMEYGEESDKLLSKGTAARGLNGILYGELVCAGFAFTFQEMMNRAGIECHYQNQKDTHAYNVVKLDGQYYGVDVTWDNTHKENSECGFRNFGQDEHFYERYGHQNYREEDDWDGGDEWNTKRVYDDTEERFDLSTFTTEQLQANYSVIADKITRRKVGSYRGFAEQPPEVQERYLPVMDVRERELTSEANADSADFVNVLYELRREKNLKLDQDVLDMLQPRIGYILDVRDNSYSIGNESNFGEQELNRLGMIRANEVWGRAFDENERQAIIDSLNQQLESAIKTYISKTYENIAECINSYETPTNDMDETRRLEEGNRRTKMDLILNSKDMLIGMGYDSAQVDSICNQIESKLVHVNQSYENTPEEQKAKNIDFLSAVFSNKAQIRSDIERIEGTELTDDEFEEKVHDANYLLDKIYTGLDLGEYGLTKDEFQKVLDDGYKS